MFKRFARSSRLEDALATIDSVAAEFGHPGVGRALFDAEAPKAAELARTDPFALQLTVFAAAVGSFYRRHDAERDSVLVGHSLGELAALTVAGGFDVADGARLVCLRSEALKSAEVPPGGMLAVELSERRAAHLVGTIGDRHSCVAVVNAPQWSVLSGPLEALNTAQRLCEAMSIRVRTLPSPYAFHSPGLAVAAEAFAASASRIRQRPLRHAVYSPVLGDFVTDATDCVALLVKHLTTKVDFLGAVRALHAEGMGAFVECGRSGLASLVRASVPDVTEVAEVAEVAPREADPVQAPKPVLTVVPRPALPTAQSVALKLRQLYAASLGFPEEAISVDADLEADLGIDSLKRTEMLSKVRAQFALPENVNDGRLHAHATLSQLAALVVEALSHTNGVNGVALAHDPPALPTVQSVALKLRQLYAASLGFPEEVISVDADLEADLGIDSLKRTEMLSKVRAEFALPESVNDGRLHAHTTLSQLGALVVEAMGGAAEAPKPISSEIRIVAPTSDVGGVLSHLREIYASHLGFPVEAVLADTDLEADLGIDSLKRTEMIGKVGSIFELQDAIKQGRFFAHNTLRELAGMISESLAQAASFAGGR
ncbi:phosphopantetheine-binding protein [Pendulispora rubella]|uniref:[acyl-carrier-protein] S-malonyltransferase n=2 Tax=Pendulispora rubella TaxID=2741070 RepID=A0ABZ2L4T7_9BACT